MKILKTLCAIAALVGSMDVVATGGSVILPSFRLMDTWSV